MSDTGPGDEMRVRNVGVIIAGELAAVFVDHTFTMETGEHGHPDDGFVGLTIDDKHEDGGGHLDVLLTAEEALLLADRLQRAAQLVLEVGEDLPDAEREYRRHSRGGDQHG